MAILLPMILMLLLGMGIGIWIVNPIIRKRMQIADTPRSPGVEISDDGTEMRVKDNDGTVRRYSLSTPWDVTTATLVK